MIMVVLDGAGDRLGSEETPLEIARTPHLDSLVKKGSLGQMFTVGKGIAPESDAGVFSLLGYDPLSIHLSRGVVETIGTNLAFSDGDLALRAGFATVEGDKIIDRRVGRNLSTEEALHLGVIINKELNLKEKVRFEFKPTVGHRAVLVFRANGRSFSSNVSNFDPAYIRRGNISIAMPGRGPYPLPKCEALDASREAISTSAIVNEFGFKARSILDRHSDNQERIKRGDLPANFILMRDAGTERPNVQGFREKWGLDSVMIADLPAELGIGKVLGMDIRELTPGTSLDDYSRRAELVRRESESHDFVYVHLKGPDEPGHDGLREEKARRISDIDEGFFSVLATNGLKGRLLCVTCDHSTPWRSKGHSDDPVPVLVIGDGGRAGTSERFTEREAGHGGLGVLDQGKLLMELLIGTNKRF